MSNAEGKAVVVAMVVVARVTGGEKMATMPPAEMTEESMPHTAKEGEEGMDIPGYLVRTSIGYAAVTHLLLVLYDSSCFCTSAQ